MDEKRKNEIALALLRFYTVHIDLENMEEESKKLAEATGISVEEITEFLWSSFGERLREARIRRHRRDPYATLP